ncbi:zinc-binding alcohol dehydrogenase family protein [Endozoicomonas elysicola]|uniref:Alcohol dehydrogenase n=1 Tax=Endozoicomonas elysicola TaxID=305900 RepID=A0A081KGY3_9GAMM|nr:zinc-binding alcohol dehydrogenase family protein [Endozoicomonas elysicola]KEI73409.1 alcohol dehydrogenase [Endozoicomonas elysicola]
MKALLVEKPGVMTVVEREQPEIQNADDVLVKIKAAGICGSDVHIYHGTSPVATYPRVVGHEMVGEVLAVGSEVSHVDVGDKVVIEPMIGCGECYGCKSGRPNACAELKVRGCHVDGGFQEYFVAPAKAVYRFDSSLDYTTAAMIEPYTIAAQITWRADIRKDDFVFIMGAGPIGLCVLEMAKLKGGRCIVSDYNEQRLKIAEELGADYLLNPSECDVLEAVREITGGMGSNVTIDAVCLPKTFEQAVEITSVAGRVMCLGFTQDVSRIAQLNITLKELDVRGSRHQTYKFKEVVELFNRRALNPEKLISHILPYDEVNTALDLIDNRPQDVCKIVLKFD